MANVLKTNKDQMLNMVFSNLIKTIQKKIDSGREISAIELLVIIQTGTTCGYIDVVEKFIMDNVPLIDIISDKSNRVTIKNYCESTSQKSDLINYIENLTNIVG